MDFYPVLELAVAHQPVRYHDLILNPTPGRVTPLTLPAASGCSPSLDRSPGEAPVADGPAILRLNGNRR